VASKEELPCMGLYLFWYSTSERVARMCTPLQESGHYVMWDARGRSETGTFLYRMQRLRCVENTPVSTFKFVHSFVDFNDRPTASSKPSFPQSAI